MSGQTELTTTEGAALVPKGNGVNIAQMMEFTLEKLTGPNAEQAVNAFAKLVELHRTIQQDEAVKSFNAAFAHLQAEMPPIPKTKHVSTAGGLKYAYAPLDKIDPIVKPRLRAAGMAIYFTELTPVRDPKNTRTRCTLVHVDGHSIFADAEAPPDNKNTKVSDMHKGGGTSSFTARYALLRVLGVVPIDERSLPDGDDDDIPTINDNQRMTIETLIADCGADLAKLLANYQIDVIDNLPADCYGEVIRTLEEKVRRRTKERGGAK